MKVHYSKISLIAEAHRASDRTVDGEPNRSARRLPRRAHAVARALGTLVALGVLASTSDASASGFATARFGGEHGHPTTFNPTAIYYNPAGIAESEGFHIFVDANIAFRSATYDHSARPGLTPSGLPYETEEPPGAAGANTGKATLSNVAVAPMIGATGKFGDFALGLGFYVPLGGSSTWDKDEDFANHPRWPGPVDGEQRWYSIEGTLRSLYWTLAGAYKIPNTGLSLGLGLNLIRSSIHTIRARTGEGDDSIENEGRSFIDVGDWAWGFGVGAMYEAIPKKLFVGASYQSRPNVAGGMKLDGELRNYFGGEAITPVEVHQDLPDIIRLGVKWAPRENLELRLFGDWTRWSAFDKQCLSELDQEDCEVNEDGSAASDPPPIQNLPRDWNDAFGIRVGGSYWVDPKVEIFTGLGYDSNAIPDENLDPALTDFHDVSVAIGGRFTIIKQLAAAISYTHFFYFERNTNGLSKNAEFAGASRGPDAGGIYTQRVGVVNVNVEAMF
jgi:long-chain fatty acid transport protein